MPLVQIVPHVRSMGYMAPSVYEYEAQHKEAQSYLVRATQDLKCDVHAEVVFGPISASLEFVAANRGVTDVIMASHGRTGLARVAVGSVADALLHRLHIPMLIVPASCVSPEIESGEPAAMLV